MVAQDSQTQGQEEFYRVYREGIQQGFDQGVRYTILWTAIGSVALGCLIFTGWIITEVM